MLAMAAAQTDTLTHEIGVDYRVFFDKSPLPMWIYDASTLDILAINAAGMTQGGYTQEEALRLTLVDLHHDGDRPDLLSHLCRPLAEQSAPRHWRQRQRNGDYMEVESMSSEIAFDGLKARLLMVCDLSTELADKKAQLALSQRLSDTLESITDGFLTLDKSWCFTYVNASAESILKRSRVDMLGVNIWDKYPDAVGSIFQTSYESAVAEQRKVSFETWYAPLGLMVAVDAYPSPHGLNVHFRDVTEQHRASQQLSEKREVMAAIVNASTEAIICTDERGVIQMFSPGAERIFRRAEALMLGQSLVVLMPERFRAAHGQHLQHFAESGQSNRMMGLGLVKGLRSDGQELDLEVTISNVQHQQQHLLVANLRDVTQRVRAQAELEQSRTQLSELSQRLMTQEKTLVRGLAQTLHDQLGQTMAAIRLLHETVLTLQTNEVPKPIAQLQAQMGVQIGQAIRQVRQVLLDLRPPLLEELGLCAALDNELRNRSLTQPLIDLSIQVHPSVEALRWPGEVEHAAFMIAREAIENSFRHAGCTSLAVRISGSVQSLQVEIADNGAGMTPDIQQGSGHLGIVGMHERAQVVGGAVTVVGASGGGTRVCFDWHSQPGL
jgi:PAS domain S-box-containing protein